MKIKVSDLIAKFLKKKKINHVFVFTGGAALHLIDSAKKQKINTIPLLHEQSCAMAADAYSRVTQNIGATLSTSGPGATNLVTGVCGAYFDSVPVIYITGQVATFRSKGKLKVRQIGFQETDCVSLFKSVTKYCVKLKKSSDILYELEKAYHIANSGRKGPVLLDIPDNLQREIIDDTKIRRYVIRNNKKNISKNQIERFKKLILNSKRPILILGWGMHLSNTYIECKKFIKKFNIPYVKTWAVSHFVNKKNNPYNLGTWGTHGKRYSNFAVQNSDLIISLGSRLDTKATGTPPSSFARSAKKIMIDIDINEIKKFKNKFKIDLPISTDLKTFFKKINKLKIKFSDKNINRWKKKILYWKDKYPLDYKKSFSKNDINPYNFFKVLSKCTRSDSIIISDTGCTIAWLCQTFNFKENQLLLHDFNNTAMGWALPAGIATKLLMKNRDVIIVTGDGSLSLNFQELSNFKNNNLNVKIFLLDNGGHSMIRQTQDTWLKSKHIASSTSKDLPKINFNFHALKFGFKTFKLTNDIHMSKKIKKILNLKERTFCTIKIDERFGVEPQVLFGKPNEEMSPLLDERVLKKEMLN